MSDNQSELWSLYGDIGNRRIVPIRSICRRRLLGIDNYIVRMNLEKSARDARDIAKRIEMLSGSQEAKENAERVADILEYWAERPGEIQELIKDAYQHEYGDKDTNSTTEYDGSEPCPYEDSTQKKACWGCHLPKKIWQKMAVRYNRESN